MKRLAFAALMVTALFALPAAFLVGVFVEAVRSGR